MYLEKTKTNSFYVIITGLFNYKINPDNEYKLWEKYTHWQNRINGGNYKGTFEYFNTSYYDGYLNNIFPEIRHDKSNRDKIDSGYLNHLTHRRLSNKDIEVQINNQQSINCKIDFADLYLFPNKIGIFSLKIILTNQESTLDDVSGLINKIRQLNTILEIDNEKISLKSFINKEILQAVDLIEDWSIYNPQLKTYNILDLKDNISDEEMNCLLFDIGNVAPLGSAKGNTSFSPSQEYFNEQLEKNKLSVFKNWSALALFDTFTRISKNFPDTFKSWELDYFQIYIHTLHIKFYMYLTNSKIVDVTNVTKNTEKIKNEFVEFINDYYQTHISYKFLPDLIQDKLIFALDIYSEVEMMETKIKRINEHAQEKREQRMNRVLLIITFLSVFSLIHDFSNWMINMGINKQTVYPWLSITSGVTVIALIFVIFYLKDQKNG